MLSFQRKSGQRLSTKNTDPNSDVNRNPSVSTGNAYAYPDYDIHGNSGVPSRNGNGNTKADAG